MIQSLKINPAHYRAPGKSMYFLLIRTQARPGRTVKQEQEQNSRIHIQAFLLVSVEAETTISVARLVVGLAGRLLGRVR